MSEWEEAYHATGHFLASKGCPNDIFSKHERIAITIRELEEENKRFYEEIKELRGTSYKYEHSVIPDLEARIEELEQFNKNHMNTACKMQTTIVQQQETITKLREALEFYAYPNYMDGDRAEIHAQVARKALKDENE